MSRNYSAEEKLAWREVYQHKCPGNHASEVKEGRGPAYFATGPWWPTELRRHAREMERLAPLYRLAADALEREAAR